MAEKKAVRSPNACIVLIALLLLALAPAAPAAGWPEKPVRIIIPWPPGGSTDIVGRVLAAELTNRLKQQVLIDNRAGAGSIVGLQIATAAPADGYTFMMTSTAYGFLIDKPKAPVDLVNSFAPVAMIGFGDSGIVVHPSLPVKTVKELIDLARKRPGEILYASSGIGGFPHMNTELFKFKTGVNLVHVPFKGGGPATADLVAGHTQMQIPALVTAMPFIQSGRLRLIATGGPQRNPSHPGVPTIAETVPGYESRIWWGVFAPPKTPPELIARFHAETLEVISAPGFQKRLEEQGGEVVKMSSAEFGRLMVSEQNKWLEVIRAAGIKGE
ncbi:MAG TPA: tripartite tricarboxylate transporter substrate binding protein [Burkholderiales bacterium]|nr:tripartite tricarboxylate transporter substrate binding protein [Burkholderiales bacterium]